MVDRPWVALYSGGKDSAWACHRALERGLPVETLVTVHPPEDSFLYHTPATDLVGLAAASAGLEARTVDASDAAGLDTTDPSARGDAELAALERELRAIDASAADGLGGVTVGAVASTYQGDRIEGVCERIGCDLYAPLWGVEPRDALERMIGAGFAIRIVQIAADGLGPEWLGRRIDERAIDDLAAIADSHGIHPMGEGGGYETLVTDGPQFDRPIRIDAEPVWEGDRGHLRIDEAWLADR
ncbi:MAG: diphthine--ammonia ligase [Halococcoides sp.]